MSSSTEGCCLTARIVKCLRSESPIRSGCPTADRQSKNRCASLLKSHLSSSFNGAGKAHRPVSGTLQSIAAAPPVCCASDVLRNATLRHTDVTTRQNWFRHCYKFVRSCIRAAASFVATRNAHANSMTAFIRTFSTGTSTYVPSSQVALYA